MKHKLYTLLFFGTLIYTNDFAQPVIKKQKVIGGAATDFFTCMYLTTDGGLIAGGFSESNKSGDKTENSKGYNDYWVVKLDKEGTIQWGKTIGGSDYDGLWSLQQTSDGGYILGGSSLSNISGDKTGNSKGFADYWIVKLDNLGNIQWDKTIGGSNNDNLRSLQQTTDGGYILGGNSNSGKSGDKTQNSRSGDSPDYWIVKTDSRGNIEWDKTIGGNNYDDLASLQQTKDGGYILGGYSFSSISGEKTANSRGASDYWVVKLNSLGNIQWDKTIGGSNKDLLTCLQQTSDNGYILGGYSRSSASREKTENSRGDYDYWVVKLNSLGRIQWDKTIGGIDLDELLSLEQTSDGGYILGGDSGSPISGEKTESSRGYSDYWAVKLSSLGTFQWDKTLGGDQTEYMYSIKEVKRNLYMAGGSSYSGISGDKTKKNVGEELFTADYWLVLLQYQKPSSAISSSASANSITKFDGSNKNFTVYPNPAKDVLHVQTNGNTTLTLTNQSGKILFTKTINGNGEINVANLSAGLYYLKNNATGEVQQVILAK